VTLESKDEDPLLILRINASDTKTIINDFKAAGFKVEAVMIKQ